MFDARIPGVAGRAATVAVNEDDFHLTIIALSSPRSADSVTRAVQPIPIPSCHNADA
jgi:hypothetical protein